MCGHNHAHIKTSSLAQTRTVASTGYFVYSKQDEGLGLTSESHYHSDQTTHKGWVKAITFSFRGLQEPQAPSLASSPVSIARESLPWIYEWSITRWGIRALVGNLSWSLSVYLLGHARWRGVGCWWSSMNSRSQSPDHTCSRDRWWMHSRSGLSSQEPPGL